MQNEALIRTLFGCLGGAIREGQDKVPHICMKCWQVLREQFENLWFTNHIGELRKTMQATFDLKLEGEYQRMHGDFMQQIAQRDVSIAALEADNLVLRANQKMPEE